MVSDPARPPVVEIEDLWPAFVATHADLQVSSPLTRAAYNTLAPTLGPWLMQTYSLTLGSAQLALESIWGCLVGLQGALASHRFRALYAVLLSPCPRWAAQFEVAVGYDGVLFAYPGILSALQIEDDRAEILAEMADVTEAMTHVTRCDVTDRHGVQHVAVSLTDVVDWLSPLSTLPACEALWSWIRTEYAPAIARYGHYDPAQQHEAPPGQELDALECRENARELLNAILPGLGDDTLAALAATAPAPQWQAPDPFDLWPGLRELLDWRLPGLGEDPGDRPS
jgi:hypothetical protein